MVRAIAAEVGKRIRARRAAPSSAVRQRTREAAHSIPVAVSAEPARADGAELDALRGALVHELDRLAAADESSAGFRRA